MAIDFVTDTNSLKGLPDFLTQDNALLISHMADIRGSLGTLWIRQPQTDAGTVSVPGGGGFHPPVLHLPDHHWFKGSI
jgi:hypothetical protein